MFYIKQINEQVDINKKYVKIMIIIVSNKIIYLLLGS